MARAAKTGISLWTFAAMIACGLIIALAVWYFIPGQDAVGAGTEERRAPTGWSKDGHVQLINADAVRQTLESLRVVETTSRAGYDRARFGPSWADEDGNGCDTRNDILARDLTELTYADSKNCTVLKGTLRDPYSGNAITFMRGKASSSAVQIDHIVALADAWPKGAEHWDETTRRKFANDPSNLLAVDGPLNNAKGASDASRWLPPNPGYHCAYVAAQVEVKASYDLAVNPGEKSAMVSVLGGC